MSKEKQIEEMVRELRTVWIVDWDGNPHELHEKLWDDELQNIAIELYNAGYRKQSEGEWAWFEVWSPSTPEHPGKCNDCGWECSRCEVALRDMVGGYWYDASTMPELPFCPNCGARMKGGA